MTKIITGKLVITGASILALAISGGASAQTIGDEAAPTSVSGSAADGGDIVVTARRRDETSIAVPVSVTALGQAQLETHGIRNLSDVAMLTPGLTVSQVSSAVGGTIVLRGVGTAAGSNGSFDQTVSINIDGVQMSRGNAMRLGQVDMAGIEILKGSQALFFGKNSPAGVISIRTADPGDKPEYMVRLGYEPIGRQTNGDLVLSGPVTDTVGLRLAASVSRTRGWFINDANDALSANAIAPGAVASSQDRGPRSTFYFLRGTLVAKPTDRLKIRLKSTFAKDSGTAFQNGGFQRIYCPQGSAQTQAGLLGGAPGLASALAVDDCKANNHYTSGDINSSTLAAARQGIDDPRGYHSYEQILESAEINYELSDSVSLTSVTGYDLLKDRHYDTFSFAASDANPNLDLEVASRYRAISQELRLTTSGNGPLNGMAGFFFEDTNFVNSTTSILASAPYTPQTVNGRALSGFGQLMWHILPELELAGGVRYSNERKSFDISRLGVSLPQAVNHKTFGNWSPEVTLTWRPDTTTTLYAAYKQGFKSGGFATAFSSLNPTSAIAGTDNSYLPETVKGGEIGVKKALFDNSLRINFAGYYNKFSNLQVNSLDNSTGVPTIRVTNAAAATNKGIEGDASWHPRALSGFELHTAANYNIAKFKRFLGACYIGQTIAEGCTEGFNPQTGHYTAQSLAGRPLVNAPRFVAAVGGSYEFGLGDDGLRMQFNSDVNYKSSYNPHPDAAPGALQKRGAFLSSGIRVYPESKFWEFAIIGNNLTNLYRVTTASNAPGTGNGALTGSTTPGGRADLTGYVNRGREILFQITLRP